MEILQFDSRSPAVTYSRWVDQLKACLPFVRVLCNPELAWSPLRKNRPSVPFQLPAVKHDSFMNLASPVRAEFFSGAEV
jgi:hypothetical protein